MPPLRSVARVLMASTLLAAASAQAQSKPRLLVTTDIGGDPDDQQSMRRLLLYANELEITGLIQGGSTSRGWSLNLKSGGYASFQIATSSTSMVIVNGTALPTNQWVHLAGTYEPGVAMRLYVNGALNASLTTGVPASQHDSALNVTIGSRPDGSNLVDGKIDEVRIYNRPLTAAEVQQL